MPSMVNMLTNHSPIQPKVYCTTVANRYSQQHILPMSQMSVSAECFYQPTVQADFDLDSEVDEQFGEWIKPMFVLCVQTRQLCVF